MKGRIFRNIHIMPTMFQATYQAHFHVTFSKTMSESMEVEFYQLSLNEGDQRTITRNVGGPR